MKSTSDSQTSERFHSLDALRGFALLLGVFFHAAESFCPERYSWAIVDVNAHWIADWFQGLSHSFRMELFFILAGFFAHLLIQKRGDKALIINRLKRIVIPFILGWFLLYPLFGLIWITGASVGGRMEAFGIPPEVHHLPAWQLTIGAITDPNFVKENFNLLHLWFLHQLVVIYAIVLCSKWLMPRPMKSWLRNTSSYVLNNIMNSRLLWYVLPIITVPILMFMDGWSVDTPNKSMTPHIPTTLVYGYMFMIGWIFYDNRQLLDRLKTNRYGIVFLIAGVSLSFAYRFMGVFFEYIDVSLTELQARTIYSFLLATSMWAMIIGCTITFMRLIKTESKFWRYIADSSYFVYMIHHLVVVPVQIAFANLLWPAGIKYILICAISLTILYTIYHLFVRYTWISTVLNGRKHERPRRQVIRLFPKPETDS